MMKFKWILCLLQFYRWSGCRTSWWGRRRAPTWPSSATPRPILGPSATGSTTRWCCSRPKSTSPQPQRTATARTWNWPSGTWGTRILATTGASPKTRSARPKDQSDFTVSACHTFILCIFLYVLCGSCFERMQVASFIDFNVLLF